MNLTLYSDSYRRKMNIVIINKANQEKQTTNPDNYEFLYSTNKIIELVRNKEVTIMLSAGPLRGQTTLAYALSSAKLSIK